MPYKEDQYRIPIQSEDYDSHQRLTSQGKNNILGLQAQLWSETITDGERIEYYLFPKIISHAERSWHGNPSWAAVDSKEERISQMEQDWGIFSQKIGEHQLKILDYIFGGVGYRLSLVGGKVMGSRLFANNRFAGIDIRVTFDGSQPDLNSQLYTAPIEIPSGN